MGRRGRRGPRRLALVLVAALGGALALTATTGSDPALSSAPLLTTPSWRLTTDTGSGRTARGPLAQERWWASGTDPGAGTRWSAASRWALIDINQLSHDNGAVGAGAARAWSYTWPRDASFVAVALARAGHQDQAWRTLRFLAGVQGEDGGFEARYTPDGTVPDDRPAQVDGPAWVLWGTDQVLEATTDAGQRLDALVELRGSVERSAEHLLAVTADGTRLPDPSPDYWEVPVRRVTLGAAAPLLTGLRSASALYAELGVASQSDRLARAADRYQRVLVEAFARRGWQRYPHGGGSDAAITFLMPPFVAHPRADVVRAWERYQHAARRDGGGLAPGSRWRDDGVSWTPEVGLVALNAAASGRRTIAEHWLDWLDAHRTPWGSLPEKVLATGAPAGPAPLAWTGATFLLATGYLR